MTETQMPKRFRDLIEKQIEIFEDGQTISVRNKIPKTTEIPIEDDRQWLKIPDVICVYVDMIGSTKFSAQKHDKSTASAYQLFTETAVRLFHAFEAPYIDVRGDGVFALFNSTQPYRAIAAAVTFKTFVEEVFTAKIKAKTKLTIGCHIGIDQKTVLVRNMGLKAHEGRTDRKNEVWAGKPINMAAKLASKTSKGELLVSGRYYDKISNNLVRLSCGCENGVQTGVKKELWKKVDLSDDKMFDFNEGFLLKSIWCERDGAEYCDNILKLDKD